MARKMLLCSSYQPEKWHISEENICTGAMFPNGSLPFKTGELSHAIMLCNCFIMC